MKAARAAFDEGPWQDMTAQDRGRILFKLAQIVRDRADELAELETRNSGKPIVESEFDIADVATCFEYYGGLATKIHGDVLPVPDNAMSLALREPIGVAGQIVPWNYPLLMAAWKLAPAICAGCTIVLKPAEQTPLTVLELASSFEEAGLPPGVVNIVTGVGETAGAAIVEHPDVDKIAFTGSAEVGKIIMRSAADTLKKISLELGGKSPNIFFADADFEAAVDGALFGVLHQPGRGLLGGQPHPGAAAHLQEVRRRDGRRRRRRSRSATAWTATRRWAPLVSREQFDRVRRYQEIGKGEAKLALGGGRATGGALDARLFRRADDLLRRRQLARASPARKSSDPWRASSRSTTKRTRCGSPTTRTTASPPRCGRATSSVPCASSRTCAPASSG